MSKQHLRAVKSEERLVRFLLTEGFGIKPGSEKWQGVANIHDERRLTFDALSLVYPGLPIDLEYWQPTPADQFTFVNGLCYPDKLRIVRDFPPPEGNRPIGQVFALAGIKGGLIIHDADLPGDWKSGSWVWYREGQKIRLQRFAEFCLAMRDVDWRLEDHPGTHCERALPIEIRLATQLQTSTQLKICMLLHGLEQQWARDKSLAASEYNGEFTRLDGDRYLVMPHAEVARVLGVSKSSVKRSFAELKDMGIVQEVNVGRYKAYRIVV